MLCENGIDDLSCKVISQLLFNRWSFALQKMPFYVVKGALLQCKRASFRRVFVTICISDSYKARNKRKSVVFRFGVDKKCKDFIK